MSSYDILHSAAHLLNFDLLFLCTVGCYVAKPMCLLIFHYEFSSSAHSPPTQWHILTVAILTLPEHINLKCLSEVCVCGRGVTMYCTYMCVSWLQALNALQLTKRLTILTGRLFSQSCSHFIAVQPNAADRIVLTPPWHHTVWRK